MTSVRMLAVGAVALFALPILTAPVRAECDERFIKKCETESEAAFVADQGATATPQTRHRASRLRTAAAKPAAAKPVAAKPVRTRLPLFAARRTPPAEPALASVVERQAALVDSPLARRFRGFIDPHPMMVNRFEDMRKPRLDAEHLMPAAMLPAEDGVAGPDEIVTGVDVGTAVEVARAQPGTAPRVVADAGAPVFAQFVETPPDGSKPGGFPLHKLMLTICCALGVAGALRFIVRA
jgi:hypothetical protein